MSEPARDLIAIGASAGGVEALRLLLRDLPASLPGTLFITVHRSPAGRSRLVRVLDRFTALRVHEPCDGECFEERAIYLAPADHHMIVEGDHIRIARTPKQHHTRPAIDPMLLSLAASHGRRVVGMLLTGNLSDGVAGLVAIKAARGLTLVQDPEEAPFPSMPRSALIYDHVDLIFQLADGGSIIRELVAGRGLAAVQRELRESPCERSPSPGAPGPNRPEDA